MRKRLINKLELEFEDEMSSTSETSLDNKKVTCEKGKCLVVKISLVIICLLLLDVVSFVFYYYYIG